MHERGVPGVLTGPLRGVVGWRFEVDWSTYDYLDEAAGLRTPLLLFHGAADDVVPGGFEPGLRGSRAAGAGDVRGVPRGRPRAGLERRPGSATSGRWATSSHRSRRRRPPERRPRHPPSSAGVRDVASPEGRSRVPLVRRGRRSTRAAGSSAQPPSAPTNGWLSERATRPRWRSWAGRGAMASALRTSPASSYGANSWPAASSCGPGAAPASGAAPPLRPMRAARAT